MDKRLGQGSESGWRLGSALLAAVALHAVIIASVQFQFSDVRPVQVERLTVAFSQLSNHEAPDASAPEAATDHRGGGTPKEQPPQAVESQPVAPTPAVGPPMETTAPEADAPAPEAAEPSPSAATLTAPAVTTKAAPKPETRSAPAAKPALSASDLVSQARRLAKLSSSMPMAVESSGRSDHQDAGVSTRFSVRESYVEGWVRKVEEWGTRNFPDRARRQNITGSLTLNVVLRHDGSIHEIKLLRSSGHEILDDAAFRIVRLAAPFAPFPEELRQQEGEFLTITRTWQFMQGDRLRSG